MDALLFRRIACALAAVFFTLQGPDGLAQRRELREADERLERARELQEEARYELAAYQWLKLEAEYDELAREYAAKGKSAPKGLCRKRALTCLARLSLCLAAQERPLEALQLAGAVYRRHKKSFLTDTEVMPLVWMARAEAAAAAGDTLQALDHFSEGNASLRRARNVPPELALELYCKQAVLLAAAGKAREAETALAKAEQVRSRMEAPRPAVDYYYAKGSAARLAGDPKAALEALRRAEARLAQCYPLPEMAGARVALEKARAFRAAGAPDSAIAAYEAALPVYEDRFGGYELRMARLHAEIARAYAAALQQEAALKSALIAQTLAESDKNVAPETLREFRERAARYAVAGKAPEIALKTRKKMLADDLATYGPRAPELFDRYADVAALQIELGAFEDAAANLRRATLLADYFDVFTEEQQSRALELRGNLYLAQGEVAKARDVFTKALDLRLARFGPKSKAAAASYLTIGRVEAELGAYPAALDFIAKARAVLLAAEKVDTLQLTEAHLLAGQTAAMQYDQARALQEYSQAWYLARETSDSLRLIAALGGMAEAEAATGAEKDAKTHLEDAMRMALDAYGPEHRTVARLMYVSGAYYEAIGQRFLAEQWFVRALRLQEKLLPAAHPDLARTHYRLAVYYYAEELSLPLQYHALNAAGLFIAAFNPEHPEARRALAMLTLALF